MKVQKSEWFFFLFWFVSYGLTSISPYSMMIQIICRIPDFKKEIYNAAHNHLPVHNFINFNQTLFTQSPNHTSSRICSEAFPVHCSHRMASLHLSELMHTLTHPGDYWQQHCQTGWDLVLGNFCLSFP